MYNDNEHLEKFKETASIINWFDYFSVEVWKMLKANFDLGNRLAAINEIELTNKLVRELSLLSTYQRYHLPHRTWKAKNESTNGNDLEIIIEIEDDKYLLFPCQCKRVSFKKGKSVYEKLWYSTDEHGFQVENLIKYAKSWKGIPIYMLYNYTSTQSVSKTYGATICSGSYLASQYYFGDNYPPKLTFDELHPPSIELSRFFEKLELVDDIYIDYAPKFYSKNELSSLPGWDEINPPIEFSDTRVIQSDFSKIGIEERISSNFSPKFRIMLSLTDYNHRIINYK